MDLQSEEGISGSYCGYLLYTVFDLWFNVRFPTVTSTAELKGCIVHDQAV